MKKLFMLFTLGLLLVGCAERREIEGKVYEPYGLIDEDEIKCDDVLYKASAGSVIVAIIFVETIFAPIYVIGYDLYEPIRLKRPGTTPNCD